MRPRRAALALALAAACLAALAAACTAATPAATTTAPPAAPTAAATAAPTPAPTSSATPPVTPTPTPTATPASKRYDRLDATGEAAVAGSWAILGADGGVIATWEALRSDAATLRLHQADASGVSRAAAYGAVEAGDLIEWRKADDCWVRYRVTGAPTRPASGSPRWEFPVEWITYAATGAGCTGDVGETDTLTVDEDAPSVIPASDITSPVRHGPYLVYPNGWTGPRAETVWYSEPTGISVPQPTVTRDIAVARRLLLWREPILPTGWTFLEAKSATIDSPAYGFTAYYLNAQGSEGVEITVSYLVGENLQSTALKGTDSVNELRIVDGYPALVTYVLPGGRQYLPTEVMIIDEAARMMYSVLGRDRSLSGSNIDAAIEIARSLYRRTTP